jgi:hypothetical protein
VDGEGDSVHEADIVEDTEAAEGGFHHTKALSTMQNSKGRLEGKVSLPKFNLLLDDRRLMKPPPSRWYGISYRYGI